ncbi:hypothetical protein [Georgenia sp. AZ-5]|uniref:hypothetical protein n=1 Tax=Georgenia sp. AZ-5 TaxID=3367526 RepID=UPI003754891D
MSTSVRLRRFLGAHDVVGASARLALSSAVAALILLGVAVLAPVMTPVGLVAMAEALAGMAVAAAAAGAVLWAVADWERGLAGAELVEEIDTFLQSGRS